MTAVLAEIRAQHCDSLFKQTETLFWEAQSGIGVASVGGNDPLSAHIASVEAACHRHVGCTLDQRPAIREQGHRVAAPFEAKQQAIEIHLAMGLQAALHLGEV